MKLRLVVVCLLSFGTLCAAEPSVSPSPKSATPSSAASSSKGVVKHRALRYGEKRADLPEGAADDRLLDLHLPSTPAPEKGYPCIVWVHGGGFSHGGRSIGSVGKELLARGYAVVGVEYYLHRLHHKTPKQAGAHGLHPDRPYPESIRKSVDIAAEDTEMALAWLAQHAKDYNLDVDRFGIGGSSAGAITSLEVAYARRKTTGVNLRVVFDICGAVENIGKIQAPAPWLVTGHGDSDKTVNVGYAQALKKRMDEISVPNHVIIVPGVGHRVGDALKEKYVAEILDFVDKALKGK